MNGLLASLRLPFAFRGPWAATAAVPAIPAPIRAVDAAVQASDSFRTLARPMATPRDHGTLEAPSIERPVAAVEPTPGATPPTPLPVLPVEPSVRVAAVHLVDPAGIRVVPFRPSSRWPLRRAASRIYDPFRGFPLRSVHLAELMDARPAER